MFCFNISTLSNFIINQISPSLCDIYFYPAPPSRAKCDTMSISKCTLTDLNAEFSFS